MVSLHYAKMQGWFYRILPRFLYFTALHCALPKSIKSLAFWKDQGSNLFITSIMHYLPILVFTFKIRIAISYPSFISNAIGYVQLFVLLRDWQCYKYIFSSFIPAGFTERRYIILSFLYPWRYRFYWIYRQFEFGKLDDAELHMVVYCIGFQQPSPAPSLSS